MNDQISVIKRSLENRVGTRVRVTSRKSRKKIVIRKGVIESTYPNIFIVRYDVTPEISNDSRRVSYSYIDILTKSIEIAFYKEKASVATC